MSKMLADKIINKILFILFTLISLKYKAQISDTVSKPQIKDSIVIISDEDIFNNSEIFTKYWHNKNIFPYGQLDKTLFTDSISLDLIDDKHKFIMPRKGGLNSGFGPRDNVFHKGLDIHLRLNDSVFAAFDGKVRYAMFNKGGYGNLVIIRHLNGLETYYAHLTKIRVKENQIVKAGEFIGTGGNTGAEWTGEHLHFEIRYMDIAIDPLKLIDYDKFVLKSNNFKLTKSMLATNIAKFKTFKNSGGVSGNVAKRSYHIVKKKDTLSKIAKKYKTTVSSICKLNNFNQKSKIRIGQSIRIF
jgi:murein DD-endopeptidase MepM/ murein hydrolase activator NlpD